MLRRVPHTYVIVFTLLVVCAVSTWIIPGGEFTRQTVSVNGVEREIIVDQSFQFVDSSPQTWQIFSAFFDGFVNTANNTSKLILEELGFVEVRVHQDMHGADRMVSGKNS